MGRPRWVGGQVGDRDVWQRDWILNNSPPARLLHGHISSPITLVSVSGHVLQGENYGFASLTVTHLCDGTYCRSICICCEKTRLKRFFVGRKLLNMWVVKVLRRQEGFGARQKTHMKCKHKISPLFIFFPYLKTTQNHWCSSKEASTSAVFYSSTSSYIQVYREALETQCWEQSQTSGQSRDLKNENENEKK